MTTTSFHPVPVPPGRLGEPGYRPGPEIPPAPAGTARARLARALVKTIAARLPIRVQAPDGRRYGAGAPGSPLLEIRHEAEFYRRVGAGTTGLAEGYMAGDWDSPDLVGLFTVFAAHLPAVTRGPVRALRRWYVPRGPTGDEATLDGPGGTSSGTTTCPTRCSPSSSTRP